MSINLMIAFATKSILLFLFLALLVPKNTMAQPTADSIKVVKFNGSTIFVYHGKKLRPKQLRQIVNTNSEASKEMRVAKNNLDIGNAFGFTGGFILGYSLGSSLGGNGLNVPVFASGAVLIAASIGFSVLYKKAAIRAVRIYNEGLSSPTASFSNL